MVLVSRLHYGLEQGATLATAEVATTNVNYQHSSPAVDTTIVAIDPHIIVNQL
jgi:hypothetical protein